MIIRKRKDFLSIFVCWLNVQLDAIETLNLRFDQLKGLLKRY